MLRKSRFFVFSLVIWHVLIGLVSPMGLSIHGDHEHMSLHWTDRAHHHHGHEHDEGTAADWHVDESSESKTHLALDQASGMSVGHSSVPITLTFAFRSDSVIYSDSLWRSRWPDGLFRPPTSFS